MEKLKLWCFRIEGELVQLYEGVKRGVFTSILLPEKSQQAAREKLVTFLAAEGVNLIEIIESYGVSENLVPADPANAFRIPWIREVKEVNGPVFSDWHLYNL